MGVWAPRQPVYYNPYVIRPATYTIPVRAYTTLPKPQPAPTPAPVAKPTVNVEQQQREKE